jgi:BolA protein
VSRIEAIREKLQAQLAPLELQVIDESHKHAGHEGARDGRGHFAVRIVSTAFEGVNLLARHRLVYDALGTLMQSDIHALSLKAQAPSEL